MRSGCVSPHPLLSLHDVTATQNRTQLGTWPFWLQLLEFPSNMFYNCSYGHNGWGVWADVVQKSNDQNSGTSYPPSTVCFEKFFIPYTPPTTPQESRKVKRKWKKWFVELSITDKKKNTLEMTLPRQWISNWN